MYPKNGRYGASNNDSRNHCCNYMRIQVVSCIIKDGTKPPLSYCVQHKAVDQQSRFQ